MNIPAMLMLLAALLPACFCRAQDAPAPGAVMKLVPPSLERKQRNMDDLFPASQDREALVFVLVKIDDKGTVIDAQLDEGGFHDQRFEDAARKIARRLKFVPATLDGRNVEYGARVPIRFLVGGSVIQGVTPEFRKEAKKVQELIEQNDVAGAHFHAQWMLSEKVKLNFEYAVLESTLAYTHARAGNVHRALMASRNVTAHTGMGMDEYQPGGPLPRISMKDFLLTKELLDPMLKLRFSLASSQGLYLDAVKAQADRQALGLAAKDDGYSRDMAKLLNTLKIAPRLRGHIRIDEKGIWDHELWFNRFAIHSLSGGTLAAMLLTCDGYSRTLTYAQGAEWSIPARWSKCRLRFEGTAATQFDIMEYREAQDATAPSAVN